MVVSYTIRCAYCCSPTLLLTETLDLYALKCYKQKTDQWVLVRGDAGVEKIFWARIRILRPRKPPGTKFRQNRSKGYRDMRHQMSGLWWVIKWRHMQIFEIFLLESIAPPEMHMVSKFQLPSSSGSWDMAILKNFKKAATSKGIFFKF